jgi:hypothetical protein
MSGRITTPGPEGAGDSARAAANSVPSAEVRVSGSAAAPSSDLPAGDDPAPGGQIRGQSVELEAHLVVSYR